MLNPQLNLVRVCPRSAGARSWPQQVSSDHNYRVIYGGTCMCTSMHGGQPINNQLSNTKQTWRTLGPVHTNIHCSCANFSTIKEYSRWVCLSWALLLNFLCSFKLLTGQFSPFFLMCGYVIHTNSSVCIWWPSHPSVQHRESFSTCMIHVDVALFQVDTHRHYISTSCYTAVIHVHLWYLTLIFPFQTILKHVRKSNISN